MKDVSHETSEALAIYGAELLRWNRRINLIGRGTTGEIVRRHIEDSSQIIDIKSKNSPWCDLGTGAGLPGLVVAILQRGEIARMTLVEADRRKATFVEHIVRKLDLDVTVINRRIEDIDPLGADIVSARALAPLPRLLDLATRHGSENATYIFPKGARAEEEIDAARERWRFSVDRIPSKTAKNATILKIRDVIRV